MARIRLPMRFRLPHRPHHARRGDCIWLAHDPSDVQWFVFWRSSSFSGFDILTVADDARLVRHAQMVARKGGEGLLYSKPRLLPRNLPDRGGADTGKKNCIHSRQRFTG